jgi:molecular chaperone GrpE
MPSSPGSNETETSAMHAAEAAAAEETPAERRVVSDRDVASKGPQPDVTGAEPPQSDVPGLEAQLAEMEDRYKRALADLDNYRKRSDRDIDRRVADARESTLRDWLEAVDSVERAMRMHPSEAVVEGMRVVLDQMEAILARQGVHRMGQVGDRFDPQRHDAVAVAETDAVPDRSVVEVVRSGFSQGDRVVRPAQVVVARPPG